MPSASTFFPTLTCIAAAICSILSTLLIVVFIMAGSANLPPEAVATNVRWIWFSVIACFVTLAAATACAIYASPWIAAAVAILPTVVFILLFLYVVIFK